jgi:hypothetical protein
MLAKIESEQASRSLDHYLTAISCVTNTEKEIEQINAASEAVALED